MSHSKTSPVLSLPPSPSSSKSGAKASWNATRSLERLLQGRSQRATYPESLPSLPALPDVTFPTFSQLTSSTPEFTQPSTGLFSALVQDPQELLLDYVERPEMHRHEVLPVILDLLAKRRTLQDLTEEEHALLNNATTTYAERVKPSSDSTSKSPAPQTSEQPDPTEIEWGAENDEDEEKELEFGEPDVLGPDAPEVSVLQDFDPTKQEAPKEISLEDFVLDPTWWKR